MKTISQEQFKKIYGENGLAQFKPVTQKTGIGATIKNAFNSGVEQFKSGIQEANQSSDAGKSFGKGLAELGEGTLKATSGLATAITSPLAPMFKPVEKGVNFVVDKISNVPAVQNFAQSKAGQTTERVAENVGNLANTVGAVAGIEGGIKGLPKVGENLGNAFDSIKTNVTKYPKQIADKITKGQINKQTQTILKESPVEKFDRYVEAGQKAISDPRELTPLEKAGETAVNTVKIIKDDLSNLGSQKSATIESIGGLKVPNIALKQIEKIKPLLQKKLTDSERVSVNEYLSELETLGKNPTARSFDATIDKIQSSLFEKKSIGAIPVTPRVKAFIKQSFHELNEDFKKSIDKGLGSKDYSALNASYTKKVKIFNALNKALGEEGNRGGSLLKRFFSPQDSGTKKLFDAIKKEYGIDLAQDATLAKFVMETLGDTRARSLLQLPPTSKLGIVQKGLEVVEKKFTSPEKVFNKARSMTQTKTPLPD